MKRYFISVLETKRYFISVLAVVVFALSACGGFHDTIKDATDLIGEMKEDARSQMALVCKRIAKRCDGDVLAECDAYVECDKARRRILDSADKALRALDLAEMGAKIIEGLK